MGETEDVDEVVSALEKASGETFTTTKVSPAELRDRAAPVEGVGRMREEIMAKMVSQMELMMSLKVGCCVVDLLANRLFPSG